MNNSTKEYLAAIYALCDPRTGQIVYIGQSVNAERRYKQHIGLYFNHGRVSAWIKNLAAEGLKPTQKILTLCPVESLAKKEQFLIDKYAPPLNTKVAHHTFYGNRDSFKITCIETGQTFESYTEAARQFGVSASTIRNKCNDGQSIYPGNFHFRRVPRHEMP